MAGTGGSETGQRVQGIPASRISRNHAQPVKRTTRGAGVAAASGPTVTMTDVGGGAVGGGCGLSNGGPVGGHVAGGKFTGMMQTTSPVGLLQMTEFPSMVSTRSPRHRLCGVVVVVEVVEVVPCAEAAASARPTVLARSVRAAFLTRAAVT